MKIRRARAFQALSREPAAWAREPPSASGRLSPRFPGGPTDPLWCWSRKPPRAQSVVHCAPPYPGREQGVWSKPLGLRRRKKGAHQEIFPGLPERRGAAGSTSPDQTESTCRSWEAAGGSPFSARELMQGGAAWKSSQRPSKRPLVWSLCARPNSPQG